MFEILPLRYECFQPNGVDDVVVNDLQEKPVNQAHAVRLRHFGHEKI